MAGILSASFFLSNSYLRRLLNFGGFSDDNSAQTAGRVFPFSFFSSNSLLRRLWSFDSSNDQNQTTAESNHSSPRHAENPIPRAMEAGSPAAADPKQDSKRMRKLVPTVSLAVAALCFGIYSSIPPDVQLHPPKPLFYNSLIAFVSLGVFTSVGLLLYFIVRPEGAEVSWIQKKGVAIAIVFFLIAFVLRIALLLPVSSFEYVWQVFFFVAVVIVVYLYAAWKKDHHNQTARDSDNLLLISVHPNDGGGN